jgi:DNA-binding response OmpR family regulator/TolA-binding protein
MDRLPYASAAPVRAAGTASVMGAANRHRPLRASDTVSNTQPLVLAVEPDERTRSLLEVGLAEHGFAVVSVSSAEEAEGYLHPELMLPSMILCETDLRGVDGFSLCGRIRADARTADLPFVLLSRTTDPFHRELAGGAGADQLFTKPLFLNDVVAMVHLMAGRSSNGGRYESDTDALPVPRLLRSLLSGVRSGRIDFHSEDAWISFREGQVVDAACDAVRGEEALRRMMLVARGNYVVTFGPSLTRATMSFGVEELCGTAYARLQRWEKVLEEGVSLDAVLVVEPSKLKAISEVPEEVSAVVLLFEGARTVRDVVLESGLDEVLALEAVGRLTAMGVLVRKGGGEQAPERDARVRALHPVGETVERADATESAPSVRSSADEGRTATSLFESTETLDESILRQLSAFRIRPVADRMDTVPASPELTAFVRHVEPPETRESPPPDEPGSIGRSADDDASDDDASDDDASLDSSTPETSMLRVPLHVMSARGGASSTENGTSKAEASADDSVDPAARAEEEYFAAELEKIVAPERPPDRRWLIVGVIGTAAVAVLAGLAVVISTRSPAPDAPRASREGIAAEQPSPPRAPGAPAVERRAGSLEAQTVPASAAGMAVGRESSAAGTETTPAGTAAAAAEGRPSAQEPSAVAAGAERAGSIPDSPGVPETSQAGFPREPGAAAATPAANSAQAALARGVRLYKAGRQREAVAVLEDVTRRHPRFAPAWVYLGLARFDGRDNAGAEQAARRALAISPRNGRALMLLASIHLDAGHPEKAREQLERYLELYPKGAFANEARQLLLQRQ